MKEYLTQLLYQYISDNNPDVLVGLENEAGVTDYLNQQLSTVTPLLSREGIPPYVMEAECMEILTADLKPSRYLYLSEILEEEFPADHLLFQSLGVLLFEIINLIEYCATAFEEAGFTANNEDDKYIRYLIVGTVSEYLDSKREKEIVEYALQQPGKISR